MNEEDRDSVIKEARINALYDVQQALGKLYDSLPADAEGKNIVRLIHHHVQQRIGEVSEGGGGRIHTTHRQWEDE